jgi:hypothetical protein
MIAVGAAHAAQRSKRALLAPLRCVRGSDPAMDYRLMWYRVFGASDAEPAPDGILKRLNTVAPVAGRFEGDETGWFRADLVAAEMTALQELQVERFMSSEEGLRAELNSWAAHVEQCLDSPATVQLMERLIQAQQLFTVHRPEDASGVVVDDVCVALCRSLAEATDGVYQIDGRGFFAADGALLLRDE